MQPLAFLSSAAQQYRPSAAELGAVQRRALAAQPTPREPDALQPPQVSSTTSNAQEAKLRADLGRIATEAGANANVSIQYRYEVGPDGQLRLVGGTVSTSERITRDAQGNEVDAPYSPTLPAQQSSNPLSDGRLAINSSDLADIFSQDASDQAFLQRLRNIDANVRLHEGQHFRAAGGLAVGTPNYQTIIAPDGSSYAVGGYVSIQSGSSTDPADQARDAATLARAASAPTDASAQDNFVAANAINQSASALQSANAQAVQAYQQANNNGITQTFGLAA